jgi:V-type H+-transporting ATPase subunit a
LLSLEPGWCAVQVEARLGELQSTLDAGIHHRDNVFNNIGYSLEQWTVMVSVVCVDPAGWMTVG